MHENTPKDDSFEDLVYLGHANMYRSEMWCGSVNWSKFVGLDEARQEAPGPFESGEFVGQLSNHKLLRRILHYGIG
jgi:hypothetical protein